MVGSRKWVEDVTSFTCDGEGTNAFTCVSPLYPSTEFTRLGQITHVLAVDQIGVQSAKGEMYVHSLSESSTAETVSSAAQKSHVCNQFSSYLPHNKHSHHGLYDI